ncbi:MAG: CopG family transcriptional regulator [Firmicutes bacterium]|nr:CopG family transcriptional regulator [Bacillota bacterium]
MTARKVRKQIYITLEQNEDLKTLAITKGISEAGIIREALSAYVAAQKEKLAKEDPLSDLIGIGTGKHTDSAQRHDYYLYEDRGK